MLISLQFAVCSWQLAGVAGKHRKPVNGSIAFDKRQAVAAAGEAEGVGVAGGALVRLSLLPVEHPFA